jgi:hypothetical protein
VDGRCLDCFTLGCAAGTVCRANPELAGECVVDRCLGVTCGEAQLCRDGSCIAATCTPACPDGAVCVNGGCVTRTCDPGICATRTCPAILGQACDPTDGRCIADPCASTRCPSGFTCAVTCGGVAVCEPPSPAEGVDVLATGGGGASCAVGFRGRVGSWLLVAVASYLLLRRRRSRNYRNLPS